MWAQIEPFKVEIVGGGPSVSTLLLSVLPSVVAVLVVVFSNRSQSKRQQDDFDQQEARWQADRSEERRRRDEERADAIRVERSAIYAAMLAAVDELTDHGIAVATYSTPATARALPQYDEAHATLLRESLRANLYAGPSDQASVLKVTKLIARIPHPARDTASWTTPPPPAASRAAEILSLTTAAVFQRARTELGLDDEDVGADHLPAVTPREVGAR